MSSPLPVTGRLNWRPAGRAIVRSDAGVGASALASSARGFDEKSERQPPIVDSELAGNARKPNVALDATFPDRRS